MIRYRQAVVPAEQGVTNAALDLLESVFGRSERALESVQLSGEELDHNRDELFYAETDGVLIGMCHLTVPWHMPFLGMLSGLCVLPSARGHGVGRRLFCMAVDAFDQAGGETLFLGTDNPAAARMYGSFGFAFHAGSNVMRRARTGAPYDLLACDPHALSLEPASARMRVPLIPLVLQRGRDTLMDANAAIVSCAALTQRACAGLYPRYASLISGGGAVHCAYDQSRTLCALGSVRRVGKAAWVDAFAAPACEGILPALLTRCCDAENPLFALLADADEQKAAAFAAQGFQIGKRSVFCWNGATLPCHIWSRETRAHE